MKMPLPTAYSLVLRLGCALLAAVSAAPPARADYQATVLSQSPVAYYRLSETGQPRPSQVTNSGSLGAPANGYYTNLPALNLPGPFAGSVAVGLDGLSQSVDTPLVAGLNTATFSVELWANPALVPKFAYLASSAELNSPRSGWYLVQDDGSTFGFGPAWVVRMFNTNAANPSVTLHATNAATGWMHLVLTYDGTTAKLYTNGFVADAELTTTNAAGLGYVPNRTNADALFSVGCRSSTNTTPFFWPGQAAEAAIYPTALLAGRVAAHHTAATTAPATYAATVLADAPLLYDRYQAPVQPVAANLGTLGSAGNGIYQYDAAPGAPGPQPPTYPGFEATNQATAFDAGGGSVQLPAFNFNTNTITISGWVNASNLQTTAAGIVVCDAATTYAGLTIDGVNGGLGLGYVWNDDPSTFNWSPTSDAGLAQLPDSAWAYVALVIQPTEADIYIALTNDPASFSSVTNLYTHVNQAFDRATLIGTDAGQYSLNGAIDEIAIWNRSLSAGELYSQYASAVGGLRPTIFASPVSPSQPILGGDTLNLSVNAGGTPVLAYQWFSNTVPILGATNSVYSKANFSVAADSGNYLVIVTNLYGSATSDVAVVTGQLATAPVIVSGPVGGTLYPGGVLNLSVVATGGGLVYQWKLAGTNLPGATSSTYTVASVTTNNGGAYTVSVTNTLGATNVGPAVVIVPGLVPGSYAATIDADGPEAWWPLKETAITNGTILADVMGRHYGAYTNNGGLTGGTPGAIFSSPGDTAINFNGDGSYGYIPYFSQLSGSAFTLELWAQQPSVVSGATAASTFDANGDGYGIGAESFWQGLTGANTFGQPLGSQAAGNPNWDPTIYPNQWAYIVISYNPANVISGHSYPWQIYVNGSTDGYIWGSNPLNESGPFIIGGTGAASFVGSVDEVAFYSKALTPAQIQAHYAAAFTGPYFYNQPQSQGAFAGQDVTLSATVVGAPPISLQWRKNGTSLSDQTNSTLTVSNVFYTTSSDIYTLLATNAFGSTLSSNAVISVSYPPTYANLTNGLVLHLNFDGNVNDSSGRGNNGTTSGSPTFVHGKIGSGALNILTDTTNNTYNYVTLGNPADFQFGAAVDFSVSYWVQLPTNALPGDLPFLCSAVQSTGGWGLTLAPAYKTGGWAWSLDNSSKVGAGVQGPADTINDGAWHNVVEVFSRANNCTTYLDGALVNATPIAGIGDVDSGGPFNIGQDPTGLYQESGTYSLDDMGLWRRALTDVEARSIYFVGQTYGKTFDTFGPATLQMTKVSGGKVGVAWQAGTLMQSTKVNGPWTAVPGATAPFYQFTAGPTNTFFGVGQ